jgi:tetratricopeptide (TPR) repeat protein
MVNRKGLKCFSWITLLVVILVACSTEKDATMNRFYHETTTKYNGLFNANELIQDALRGYMQNRKEDFSEILPIEPMPDEDEAIELFPALDTAIVKCTKVLAKHSMPNPENRGKKDEYNAWIDRVWLKIGEAKYIKGEYQDAISNFEYITKFFKKKPSKFTAKIWIAKCYIRLKDYKEADFILKEIEKDRERLILEQIAAKNGEKTTSKFSKSDADDEKPMRLNKDFEYEFYKAKADLAIEQKKWVDAEKAMIEVVRTCKNKKEKARMHYILAQLSVQNGNRSKAVDNYTATLRNRAKFEMHFSARLNRAMASSGTSREKLIKELNKMARDGKNAEYRDQIYFALGDMEQTAGKIDLAMGNYTKSVFYSISNNTQKGISYERMGDVRFAEKNYVKAQKYYDSCVQALPETHKRFETIQTRARRLKDLVVAIETAQLKDSLLRIAAMPEDEQLSFLKDVKKQLEEKEKQRKEAEARRMEELQRAREATAGPAAGGSGGKWYFYNPKQRSEGFEDFKRTWGQRELEDDWRRSTKTPTMQSVENIDEIAEGADSDSIKIEIEKPDPFSIEALMLNIPKSDSAIHDAQEILLEALYKAGRIYQEELDEKKMAIHKFEDIISRNIENEHVLLSSFQLYQLYKDTEPEKCETNKSFILNNYPTSDYANYIRDPEFFVKKKEREKLDLADYEKLIERFGLGMYSLVKSSANNIAQNEPKNAYRAGYLLLGAMAQAALTADKESTIPAFERVVTEYPETPEASRATEMINIIKNGYSPDIIDDFNKKSEFEYTSNVSLILVVLLEKSDNGNDSKTAVGNFAREFYSADKLKVQLSQFSEDKQFIMVRDFQNEAKGGKFINSFQKTKKHVVALQSREVFLISNENFAKLIASGNVEGYIKFYKEYY